jgi:hypothetical protein
VRLLDWDGRRSGSSLGDCWMLELDVPPVDGRYDSQSLGIGGTGGIRRPSSASTPRLSVLTGSSLELCIEEMSLPTLPRRFGLLDVARREMAAMDEDPEREVADVPEVESRDPLVDVVLPAPWLAREDEPRLTGLAFGMNGRSEVVELGRLCDGVREGCWIWGERGDRGMGTDAIGVEGDDTSTGVPPTLLPPPPSLGDANASKSFDAADDPPVLSRARRFALMSSRSSMTISRLDVLALVALDAPENDLDTRGDDSPSSLRSASAVPASAAASASMSPTPSNSRSRVWRRIDAATVEGET